MEMDKKKILIIVVSIAILLVLIGGIVAFTGSKNKEEIGNTNYSDTDTNNDSSDMDNEYENTYSDEDIITGESEYNFNSLDKVYGLDEIEGKIIDIYNAQYYNYMCTNNKVYEHAYGNLKEIINSNKNIKNIKDIYVIGLFTTIILENMDNSYSIYLYEHLSETPELAKEIEGIDLENMIFAVYGRYISASTGNSTLDVVKEYENQYFVDSYEIDNDSWKVQSKKLKLPLYLEFGSGFTDADKVNNIKQVYYSSRSNKVIFALDDGKIYSSKIETIAYDLEDNYAIINTDLKIEDLENVDIVFGNGSSIYYSRPLVKITEDSQNLYTYNSDVDLFTLGTPEEQYKITIPLPQGYTVEDIKKVIFDDDLIIEFNDKSIYISERETISELKLHEELTTLNKDGKLIKIAFKSIDNVALLDNKCIYEIDI